MPKQQPDWTPGGAPTVNGHSWRRAMEPMANASVDPWTGRFRDPEAERRFHEESWPDRWSRSVVGIQFTLGIWTLIALLDLVFRPDLDPLSMLGFRSLPVVYVILALWIAPPTDDRGLDLRLIVGMGSFAACATPVVTGVGLAPWIGPAWIGVLLIVVSIWDVLPVRRQLAVSCGLIVIYVLSTREPSGLPTQGAMTLAVASMLIGTWFQLQHTVRSRQLLAEAWRNKQVSESRSMLLAALAHEVRTPLAACRVAVGLGLADPSTGAEMIRSIDGRLEHLSSLVDDVLRFGQLELGNGKLEETDFDSGSLLAKVGNDIRLQSGDILVSARTEVTAIIRGDEGLLRSAITGLASNAIRHAEWRVQMSVGRASEGVLEILVDDDGPGIPEPERKRIFEPLVALRSHRHGLGIGLTIARRIARAHGGELEALESPIGGARMRITLPATSIRKQPRSSLEWSYPTDPEA